MDISDLIVEFYERLSSWENDTVKGTDLTLPQMHTVEILGINGPMIMKDLASRLGVTTGTLTIGIDNLEKKGLVERIANPRDRRSYLISLTPAGKSHQEEHHRAHARMTEASLAGFTNGERETFLLYLSRFLEGLDGGS